MEEIVAFLLGKLSKKGLSPVEIPKLIRDVLTLIKDGGDFTVGTINEKLESLGWKEQIIDDFTFELIISLLENTGEHEITRHTIH